ncbi:hypothetical protein PAXRUDRAFT_175751, partial [Paxillus rubicundulus Ve08.2h10]
ACAICLGWFLHDIKVCTSSTLWDGSEALSKCSVDSRIINQKGTILCFDWQCPNGCESLSHSSKHECSGCGSKSHGAQSCPRGLKD